MAVADGIRQGIYRHAAVRRITRWLDAPPHPLAVCEVAPGYVAGARWGRAGGDLDGFAIEPLPPGAITPTAVETNLLLGQDVRDAVGTVLARLRAKGEDVALLVPDPVVRVFVLHFDVFPRSQAEAVPLLRWRLKKSVPFEAEETLISFMRQAPREDGVDIVTALARLRIVREYEQLLEAAGVSPGVVMSSTLATLPLLEDSRPALLARVAGRALTTVIVRDGNLSGYRCIDLPAAAGDVTAPMLLDEIYPLAAYYQDTWAEGISVVRLSGLEARTGEVSAAMEAELGCPVTSLLSAAAASGHLGRDLQPLVDRELDALAGWPLHQGA